MCKWITGKHYMWLLSLVSLVPALGILHVMDKWTREEMGGECRNLARIMTVTSGLYLVCALTIRMDMLLTFFIVMVLREAWKIMQGTERSKLYSNRLLFSLYIFLAVFTKGPFGILIPLCSIAVYVFLVSKRKSKPKLFFRIWNWQVWSVLILLFIAWFAATYAEGRGSYLHNLLFHQTIGRAVNSFHHNNPFYYYAICIWYSLAPWSLFVIGIFVAALRKKVVKTDLQKFIMTIATTTFVLLSCISSKLQIYMLPSVPFFTYSAAMFMPRFRESPWLKIVLVIPAFILSLALPAIYIFSTFGNVSYLSSGMIYASATVLTLTGVYSLYSFRKKTIPSIIEHIGAGILISVFVAAFAFPEINKEIGYRDVCKEALRVSKEYGITDFKTWRVGRAENMDVYLKRQIKVIPKDEIPPKETGDRCVNITQSKDADYFQSQQKEIIGQYAVILCPK